jgi:hypothetical protein
MSSENDVRSISVPAAADLSAAQYRMMDINSSGQIATVATKGAKMAGVLQDKPAAAGRIGALGYSGVTKVELGDTVAAGAEVISDANGAAVATDAADQYILGVCLEGGTVGEVGKVLIKPYMRSA